MQNHESLSKFSQQAGVALPTVLLVSVLLVSASAALITAVSSSAVNSTDALSETKAYYTAESGVQAAVHALRNGGVNYRDAVNFTNGDLSTWISYSGGTVPVGTEGQYRLKVVDPDNVQTHIDFVTDAAGVNAGFSKDGVNYTPTIEYLTDASNKTVISWQGFSPDPAIAFGGNPFVISDIGGFKVTNVGTGSPINTTIHFRVNLRLVAGDPPTWVLKGTIAPPTATVPYEIKFVSYGYRMHGSNLWLCASTGTCPTTAPAAFAKVLNPGTGLLEQTTSFAVRLTPMEPSRLLLTSTGTGPHGSRKQLEAMIHKTFFPAVPPAAGILMVGPNASFTNGNGRPQYRGCDPLNPSVCVPSIGFTDPGSLDNLDPNDFDPPPNGHPLQGTPNPDPPAALMGEDLPDWQKFPSAMDAMINQWRFLASQKPGAIKPNNATLGTGSYGDFNTGLGLTFCDGNCTLNGDGGGILIVKGKLTTSGGISFKGMIVVLGTEGVLRNGNGGPDDQIIGSLVIAPYTLNPDTWLSPRFSVNGGGTSLVTYSGLDYLFDGGLSGASNFVSGVVEK